MDTSCVNLRDLESSIRVCWSLIKNDSVSTNPIVQVDLKSLSCESGADFRFTWQWPWKLLSFGILVGIVWWESQISYECHQVKQVKICMLKTSKTGIVFSVVICGSNSRVDGDSRLLGYDIVSWWIVTDIQRSFPHRSLGSEQFKGSSSDKKVDVLCL